MNNNIAESGCLEMLKKISKQKHGRSYHADHKEERKQYNHTYYIKNRDVILQQQKEYGIKHLKEGQQYRKIYFQKHRSEIRPKRREYERKHVLTMKNGKSLSGINKRPWVTTCEVCSSFMKRPLYHHWDDSHPEWGMWICPTCHDLAEATDKGKIQQKYLELKQKIVDGKIKV